jgi:predicted MFS family arabinose efflux permease
MVTMVSNILLFGIENLISVQLVKMGVNEDNVSFFFCIVGVAYIIWSPITPKLCELFHRRYLILWGIVLLVISNLLFGPCGDIYLP